jgi:hypothetical protein
MPAKRVGEGQKAKRSATRRVKNDRGGPVVEGTASVSVVPIAMDKNRLDQEVAYYLEHLPEWHDHEGQHVLIHGQEHFGFFPTHDDALAEGYRTFGRIPLLVKQVRYDERPRPMTIVIL